MIQRAFSEQTQLAHVLDDSSGLWELEFKIPDYSFRISQAFRVITCSDSRGFPLGLDSLHHHDRH